MRKLFLVLFLVFCFTGIVPAHAADFTQEEFTLISHQLLAGDTSKIGSALNVKGYLYGYVSIFDAPVEGNNPTSAVVYEIQTITTTSGNDGWCTWFPFSTSEDTPATEAITVNTSSNIFSVVSVTDFPVAGWLYAQDTSTVHSGDWDKIQAVAAPYITINDTVNYPKTSSDVLWEADVPAPIYVDFGGVARIRVNVYNQMATDNDHHIWVKLMAVKRIE